MEKQCIECGHPNPEEHHIVFRSQQQAMISCPHNKITLCYKHHRGDSSPHMVREIDIEYKKNLQQRLGYLFSLKECYSEEEIKEILMIPNQDARKLVKSLLTVIVDDEAGYRVEDVIRQCMGGRLYL